MSAQNFTHILTMRFMQFGLCTCNRNDQYTMPIKKSLCLLLNRPINLCHIYYRKNNNSNLAIENSVAKLIHVLSCTRTRPFIFLNSYSVQDSWRLETIPDFIG